MLKWFVMDTSDPLVEVPTIGQMFRIGPDVGECISIETNGKIAEVGMDTDCFNIRAEINAERESLGNNWW